MVVANIKSVNGFPGSMAKISRQRYLFSGPGTYYVDLWNSTSIQERKLHPQMQVCHVAGGLIKDSNNDSVVRINVAPDTWVTRTALRRGKRLFDKHIKGALEATSTSVKPKYHDFKVFLNSSHGTGVTRPCDATGTEIPRGEWIYSNFHSEDVDWNVIATAGAGQPSNREADSFNVMICGDHIGSAQNWTRIGLIKSWFDSRAEPDSNDPDLPASLPSDPLVNLFDEADAADEIILSLTTDNDRPPYATYNHFGKTGNGGGTGLQRVAFAATQSGAGQISAMNGFSAIAGLLEVHITQGQGSGEVEMILDVMTKGDKI